MSEPLSMWSIYERPSDYPEEYVARRFEIGGGPEPRPTAEIIKSASLDELRRAMMQRGLVPLARAASDQRQIVESWV